MTELDFADWAKSQLAAAKVPAQVGKSVAALVDLFDGHTFPNQEQRDQAADLFAKLAKEEALVDMDEDVWTPVQVGFMIQVGDTVRVRANAFSGDAGLLHNGRIGRVLAKRSGDIIVRTTDDRPVLDGAHYPPSALEIKAK